MLVAPQLTLPTAPQRRDCSGYYALAARHVQLGRLLDRLDPDPDDPALEEAATIKAEMAKIAAGLDELSGRGESDRSGRSR